MTFAACDKYNQLCWTRPLSPIYCIKINVLISESSESSMHPSGIHKYRFELQVPPTTPSSFEGGFGYVRYWCKATIDRPWRFNHDTKNPFTLIRHVDLNHHLEYRVRKLYVDFVISKVDNSYLLQVKYLCYDPPLVI